MIKKLFVAIVILLFLSGCIDKDVSTNVYVCDTGSMLYLHTDGTYHSDPVNSMAGHGNYTETLDDKLFLDMAFGMSFVLIPDGTNYTDADGDTWVLLRP